MELQFEREGKRLTVRLFGELDHHYAEQARAEVEQHILQELTRELVIDVSGLRFMDSSGIGMVLGRYRTMQALGGSMRITGAEGTVDKLLRMAGIDKLMKIQKEAAEGGE